MIQQAMDGIMDKDYFFAIPVKTCFVCKMEILTNKFLPPRINPILSQASLRVYPITITQILNGIIQTVFLVLNRLMAKGDMS